MVLALITQDERSSPNTSDAEQILLDTDFSQIAGFTPTSRQLDPSVQIDPACENEVKASL